MSLSIVLSCYNEVPVIFESYGTLSAIMKVADIDHEFIIVDDGSEVEVQQALEDFFRASGTRLLLLGRNGGRGGAVAEGIRAATKEYVGFIDTDLEIPAYALPVLYHTAIALHADMVMADRVYRWDLNPLHLIRNFGSYGLRLLSWMMMDLQRLDTETGAKVFRRSAIMEVLDHVSDTRWFWDTEIVAEALKRSQMAVQVPIVVMRRSDKDSTVRPLRDTFRYLKAVASYRRKKAKG